MTRSNNNTNPDCISKSGFELLKHKLNHFGHLEAEIISNSMEPLICTGESIRIHPISDIRRLRRFDVVVFWDGSYLICHYFLRHSNFKQNNKTTLLTKGLRSAAFDVPIEADQVLGYVKKDLSLWMRIKETLQIWSWR